MTNLVKLTATNHARLLAGLLAALAAFLPACNATAQTIYRIVGADGKVTFSDKPPIGPDQGKVAATGVGAGSASASSTLPFELRQVASKYPVTLYSSKDCAPCDAGRNNLKARGIPFAERTVSTSDDADYIKRLMGDTTLPFLSIGGQKIKGYSDSEWNQYLDAAGYPKTSALPAGYQYAPAVPVYTVPKSVEAPKVPEKAAEPVAPPTGPTPTNPSGIIF